jgi:hypothetical protein
MAAATSSSPHSAVVKAGAQTDRRHFARLERAFGTIMASTHSGRRDASTSATSSSGTALAHQYRFPDYVGSSSILTLIGILGALLALPVAAAVPVVLRFAGEWREREADDSSSAMPDRP